MLPLRKPGWYVARYAFKGTQVVKVLRGPSLLGRYVVRKWLRASRRWTGEVSVLEGCILRPATQAEIDHVRAQIARPKVEATKRVGTTLGGHLMFEKVAIPCKCGHAEAAHDQQVKGGWCTGEFKGAPCDCDGYEAEQGGSRKP